MRRLVLVLALLLLGAAGVGGAVRVGDYGSPTAVQSTASPQTRVSTTQTISDEPHRLRARGRVGTVFRQPSWLVRSTLKQVWHRDFSLGGEPALSIDDRGMEVTTGLYAYRIPWRDVRWVQAACCFEPDGRQALAILMHEGPALYLTDIDLGEGTGEAAQLARRYRTR